MTKTCNVMRIMVIILFLSFCIFTCDNDDDNGQTENGEENNDIYDVDNNGIPKFIGTDYIDIDPIYRISKFRSGIGHDYSDDFESCRSMKHYFHPYSDIDWSTIRIYSPVPGTICNIMEEWAGFQIRIRSTDYPAFYFILFHVDLNPGLAIGDEVSEGQQLGSHIGPQTWSDIAIGVNTPTGWKLISYFDAMPDNLFQNYQSRGLHSRNDVIISEETRNTDPLTCQGENFTNSGNLENWVYLNETHTNH